MSFNKQSAHITRDYYMWRPDREYCSILWLWIVKAHVNINCSHLSNRMILSVRTRHVMISHKSQGHFVLKQTFRFYFLQKNKSRDILLIIIILGLKLNFPIQKALVWGLKLARAICVWTKRKFIDDSNKVHKN